MFDFLLDLLFPRRSLTGESGTWITKEERRSLSAHPFTEETIVLRRRGLQHIDRIVAGSTYHASPLLQKAIRTFKYQRIPGLQEELAQLIVDAVASSHDDTVVLCPVPLHWSRQFQRGFNQAALLADRVGESAGLPVQHLLKRMRSTGHQAWRKRDERLAAVRDAFRATRSSIPPHVILIDDLSTTGATLDACAKALKQEGAEFVEGWVVAHG